MYSGRETKRTLLSVSSAIVKEKVWLLAQRNAKTCKTSSFKTWKKHLDPSRHQGPNPVSDHNSYLGPLQLVFQARQSRGLPGSNCRRWLFRSSSIYRPVRNALRTRQNRSEIAQKTAGRLLCFWESPSFLAFYSPSTLSPRIQDLRSLLHRTAPIRLFFRLEGVLW